MTTTQALPGKKVKLAVWAEEAGILREQGQAFSMALMGKTIGPQSLVSFGDVLLGVKGTKPKGPIKVVKNTAIKMSVTKERPTITCPGCGQVHTTASNACQECGTPLDVVTL